MPSATSFTPLAPLTPFAPFAPSAPFLGRSYHGAGPPRLLPLAASEAPPPPPAPPPPSATPPPAPPTPPAPPGPSAAAAIAGALAAALSGATRLDQGHLWGLHGHELDARCEVRVHLHHSHFGNLGRSDSDAGATRAAAEPRAARRHRDDARRRCGGRGRGRDTGGARRLRRLGGRVLR